MAFASPEPRRARFAADTVPSPARAQLGPVAHSPIVPSPSPSMASSPGLIDRIMERKRAAFGDLSNSVEPPPGPHAAPRRTRARLELATPTPSREEESGDKVAVQRFTLISRGAAPAKRAKVEHNVLMAPPRVAAQLGDQVQVCRCSDCDRSGLRRRMSGSRLCRRDTESHPEYALLLLMSDRFEAECSDREDASALVTEACCREKTAYFILGAGSTTVGYVAAELRANRRVKRVNESVASDAGEGEADDDVPILLQLYVEPEFRGRGYAVEAMKLLLRDHQSIRIDDPSAAVLRLVERLGFTQMGSQVGDAGRPLVTLMRTSVFPDP